MTYAAGSYRVPGLPQREYVGWEPSDLQPHARVFQNERAPEVYYGFEQADLKPYARQFQPYPGAQCPTEPLRVPPTPSFVTPTQPHQEYKRLQTVKRLVTPGPFEPFPKSTICSLRTT